VVLTSISTSIFSTWQQSPTCRDDYNNDYNMVISLFHSLYVYSLLQPPNSIIALYKFRIIIIIIIIMY